MLPGQIVGKFKTDLSPPFKLDSMEISIDTVFEQSELSKLVNELLKNQSQDLEFNYQFDFIIGGTLLRSDLSSHIKQNNISTERTIEIEYIFQLPEPKLIKKSQLDDWVTWISPSENFHLVGLANGSLSILNTKGKLLQTLVLKNKHSRAFEHCFTNDSRHIIASSFIDQTIQLQELKTNKQGNYQTIQFAQAKYKSCLSTVNSISFLKESNLMCIGKQNGTLGIYNIDEGKQYMEETVNNKKVKLNVKQLEPKIEYNFHSQEISTCEWVSKDIIITGSYDHSICQFNVKKEKTQVQIFTKDSCVTDLFVYNNQVISSHEDGYLKLWDLRTDTIHPTSLFKSSQSMISQISGIENNSNLQLLAGSFDGSLKIWDLRSDLPLYSIKSPNTKILSVCWNSSEQILFGGSDCKVSIYSCKQE